MNDSTEERYQFSPPPPVSIVEQLAQLADKSEVMSLLEFKEEQQLDKNDPLWTFLLEFKTIENSINWTLGIRSRKSAKITT